LQLTTDHTENFSTCGELPHRSKFSNLIFPNNICKEITMKIRTNVKAGGITYNHNEKLTSKEKSKDLKTLKTKLRLNKETIRELKSSDLRRVAGGASGPPCGSTYTDFPCTMGC
jgi:hypothetical protein